jgi:hypothetical protein
VGRELKTPTELLNEIERFRAGSDGKSLAKACRQAQTAFRALIAAGDEPGDEWRSVVRAAMQSLGGQGNPALRSMADYDHRRYGPFLAISNEGEGAPVIKDAAIATAKALALPSPPSPHTLGIAIDGERLGGVGEVVIGPSEFEEIWFNAVDRLLMTTNVGSRANLRVYQKAPVLKAGAGDFATVLAAATTELSSLLKPFREAPGGARPLAVSISFAVSNLTRAQQIELLRALRALACEGDATLPGGYDVALHADIRKGGATALREAIGVAGEAGLQSVVIHGDSRSEVDTLLSAPGLLNCLSGEELEPIEHLAEEKGVHLVPQNQVDADTVARHIWSALSTARSMGFDLGKYGLYPLTLEEADAVVARVAPWFSDWSAAPVFYVDQGIVAWGKLYRAAEGLELWLRRLAVHKIRLVLIDTVDKSMGWKLLRKDGDAKGLLTVEEIVRIKALGDQLNIKIMWAGGIEAEHAYELGRAGVFGIYVTTAVCDVGPVFGDYVNDAALASVKRPNRQKILNVKTMLEAGFFSSPAAKRLPAALRERLKDAGTDVAKLNAVLGELWKAWWN